MTTPAISNATINAEIRRALQSARSRELRTLEQWIEKEVYIADGPYEGFRYAWDRQPVHRLIVREIDSGNWSEIYITGPSQSGKTLIAFVYPMMYHLTEMGESLVMGVPEARMADDKYKIDILPPMKASPMLAELIPSKGPGSKGGVVRDTIAFTNGANLKIMTRSGSDQSKAGFTARVVCVTEAAGFSRGMTTSLEADPLKQLQARQRAYDRDERRLYVEGTVTVEEELPWSAREDSSQSEILSECPWCGEWVLPGRENLVGYHDAGSSGEAGRLAYWECPECHGRIDDEMRRDMVRAAKLVHSGQEVDEYGNIVGAKPDTDRLWVRYTAWHNMFVSTQSLGQEEWRASRMDPEEPDYANVEKERCQFVWVTPYKEQLRDRDPLRIGNVVNRRDAIGRGVCPPDTTHLAAGVDLGLNLAWYVVMAGREDGRTHYVDYGPLDVPSNDFDLPTAIHKTLADLLDTLLLGYRMDDHEMVPSQVWIDAGWEKKAVFEFCASRGSRRRNSIIFPVFGRGSGQMQAIYSAPKKRGKGILEIGNEWHMTFFKEQRSCAILANADYWKGQIHHAFHLPDDRPGASTLFSAPQAAHKQLARHITNEQKVLEFVPGRGEVVKWQRQGAQHLLDASVYARAALSRAGFRPRVEDQTDQSD